jgi:hypothetical protein
LIGATNEKPRLRKQPGFSSDTSGSSSYQTWLFPNAPAAMMLKAKAASGDDTDPLSYRRLFRFLRF